MELIWIFKSISDAKNQKTVVITSNYGFFLATKSITQQQVL